MGARRLFAAAVGVCLALAACTQDYDQFFEGTGAAGATGGSGGSGGSCNDPGDCPGTDGDCHTRTCEDGSCGVDSALLGSSCDEDGGAVCNDSGDCVECNETPDCTAAICVNEMCVPPECTDGALNGDESDVDCGGSCPTCADGLLCGAGTDCTSQNCVDGVCCDTPCADVCQACNLAGTIGVCTPHPDQTDPDDECTGADVCTGNNLCQCADTMQNGTETGVDCGGGACMGCANGITCAIGTDCTSGNCPAADLVCCDLACSGVCEGCLAAETGGTDGVCHALTPNTDPDDECVGQPVCNVAAVCSVPCDTNSCTVDADCTAAATGGECAEVAGDCYDTSCVGNVPGGNVEAGATQATDFNTWQNSDDETQNGGQRWYCNATLPVTATAVLTNWQLYVENNGSNGEVAQLAVIRCAAGGGGTGPALSGCIRVGLGPAQTITGVGLQSFTLTGSTQLDGVSPSASGIVVQTGDYICADSNSYDIGVDCNASATTMGCPGADFNTQQLANLDNVAQPFNMADSDSDGTLMIKAFGNATPIAGACTDLASEPDTTLCTVDGGDTCCTGDCVVGPSGAGTCI